MLPDYPSHEQGWQHVSTWPVFCRLTPVTLRYCSRTHSKPPQKEPRTKPGHKESIQRQRADGERERNEGSKRLQAMSVGRDSWAETENCLSSAWFAGALLGSQHRTRLHTQRKVFLRLHGIWTMQAGWSTTMALSQQELGNKTLKIHTGVQSAEKPGAWNQTSQQSNKRAELPLGNWLFHLNGESSYFEGASQNIFKYILKSNFLLGELLTKTHFRRGFQKPVLSKWAHIELDIRSEAASRFLNVIYLFLKILVI